MNVCKCVFMHLTQSKWRYPNLVIAFKANPQTPGSFTYVHSEKIIKQAES